MTDLSPALAENDARCSCGNRFDGDNFCMPSACQWEGIDEDRRDPSGRVIPSGERDCNGYALGSSCGCESSADCPASRPIPPAKPTERGQ